MRIVHHPTQDDGGGTLEVTAETEREFKHLFMGVYGRHSFPLIPDVEKDPMGYATAVTKALEAIGRGEGVTYHHQPANRLWYVVEDTTGCEFLEPYAKLLKRFTGYEDTLDDMDLMPAIGVKAAKSTHIITSLDINTGDIAFSALIQSEPWAGRNAVDYARVRALDYVREDVGGRPFAQEFIQRGNGGYVRNPDYGKHRNAEPCTGNPDIWRAIFTHWAECYATPGQRDILERDASKNSRMGLDESWMIRRSGHMAAFPVSYGGFHILDAEGTTDYDGKGTMARHVTWEEFHKA